MKTLAFILLGGLASIFAGLLGSLLLGAVAALCEPIKKVGGRYAGLVSMTALNTLLMLTWTAAVIFWLKAGTPPYGPAMWAAFLIALCLAISPVVTAYESSQRIVQSVGLGEAAADALFSLNVVFVLQLLGAAAMLFWVDVLGLWDWLPVPDTWILAGRQA